MTYNHEDDLDPFPQSHCGGCGLPIICTPDGWQHDCAPWFVDGDHRHELLVPQDAQLEALRWIVDHCQHRPDDLPEPGDRCKDCGIAITWTGPGPYDWEPAVGAIPWAEDEIQAPPLRIVTDKPDLPASTDPAAVRAWYDERKR